MGLPACVCVGSLLNDPKARGVVACMEVEGRKEDVWCMVGERRSGEKRAEDVGCRGWSAGGGSHTRGAAAATVCPPPATGGRTPTPTPPRVPQLAPAPTPQLPAPKDERASKLRWCGLPPPLSAKPPPMLQPFSTTLLSSCTPSAPPSPPPPPRVLRMLPPSLTLRVSKGGLSRCSVASVPKEVVVARRWCA